MSLTIATASQPKAFPVTREIFGKEKVDSEEKSEAFARIEIAAAAALSEI